MFIALTGLHGAGKSYFSLNIAKSFNFMVYNKKEIVRKLCERATGNPDNWNRWYNDEYEKDPVAMTKRILYELPLEQNIILDAVHSNLEWDIIKSIVPDAALAVVITPYEIRKERKGEYGIDKGDASRIRYWHTNGATTDCLLTSACWSFNGAASLETNLNSFNDFITYLASLEKEKTKIKKI